jgi:hypothetical protein
MWRKALLMVLGTWFPVTSFIFQFISGKLKSPPSRKMAELGFDVIRRDRKGDTHGGVLIASKSEYGLTQVNVSKEAEMITFSHVL